MVVILRMTNIENKAGGDNIININVNITIDLTPIIKYIIMVLVYVYVIPTV